MPQFDSVNFLNQIFWTFLFFLVFYFVLLKNYLPCYGTALKARKKILYLGKKSTNDLMKTQKITTSSLDLLLLKNLDEFRLDFIVNNTIGIFWTLFPNSSYIFGYKDNFDYTPNWDWNYTK